MKIKYFESSNLFYHKFLYLDEKIILWRRESEKWKTGYWCFSFWFSFILWFNGEEIRGICRLLYRTGFVIVYLYIILFMYLPVIRRIKCLSIIIIIQTSCAWRTGSYWRYIYMRFIFTFVCRKNPAIPQGLKDREDFVLRPPFCVLYFKIVTETR